MEKKDVILPNIKLNRTQLDETTNLKKVRPKVLFFDVNETLLDLAQMKKQVGLVLGGKENLLSLWFTTMLQYSLVTSAAEQYYHFENIGAASLQMVAATNGITISERDAKKVIIESLRNLPVHSEVKAALTQLKKDGYKLVALTNSSNESVKAQFENAGLTAFFEERLSIEDVGKFKPFRDTYNWAANKLEVKPEECMLIAAHGWDVAGALWAGWRAAFISRPGQQIFPLAPKTEIIESDLKKVAEILVNY
ncbi:haloacid dehalogenase type II, partial [uncultured Flavobacterium sp.]|uniref:haloacid dehalogenase type II n=1 Tax=uncultured Flavobacterium sp. TaxID=165435 RepID=UPI0030EE6F6F